MTEELVTLETAKMLREKGFNEPCMIAINIEDSMVPIEQIASYQ